MSQAFPRHFLMLQKSNREQGKKLGQQKYRGFEPGHKRPDPDPRYLMFNEFWQYEKKDKQVLSI